MRKKCQTDKPLTPCMLLFIMQKKILSFTTFSKNLRVFRKNKNIRFKPLLFLFCSFSLFFLVFPLPKSFHQIYEQGLSEGQILDKNREGLKEDQFNENHMDKFAGFSDEQKEKLYQRRTSVGQAIDSLSVDEQKRLSTLSPRSPRDP